MRLFTLIALPLLAGVLAMAACKDAGDYESDTSSSAGSITATPSAASSPTPTNSPTPTPTPSFANEILSADVPDTQAVELTPCEALKEAEMINPGYLAGELMVYRNVSPGTPILFPAVSGVLREENNSLDATGGALLYDLPDGTGVIIHTAAGQLNPDVTNPTRGTVIGYFSDSVLTGTSVPPILDGSQILASFVDNVDSGITVTPTVAGCLRSP